MNSKNGAFRSLKPPCVKLNQAILTAMQKNGDASEVPTALRELLSTLRMPAISHSLDGKLADYVFFPISNVLKQLEILPAVSQELTLGCISILLQTAWKQDIPVPLGIQFLILFSFLADAASHSSKNTEESQELLFKCMHLVLDALGQTEPGSDAITSTANIPHIGKLVSVILDALAEGNPRPVQIAALETLDSFCTICDTDAFSLSFFPGIISALTKCLTPKPTSKPSAEVLSKAVSSFSLCVCYALADDRTNNLPHSTSSPNGRNTSWLQATASQVKLALANVVKLRQYHHPKVKKALSVCLYEISVKCWKAVSESRRILLEGLLMIAAEDEKARADFSYLLICHETSLDIVGEILRTWVVSLPVSLLQNEDVEQARLINQISFTYGLLSQNNAQLDMINDTLTSNLRDGIAGALVRLEKSSAMTTVFDSLSLEDRSALRCRTFENVLAESSTRKTLFGNISHLIEHIAASSKGLEIAEELLLGLVGSTDEMGIAGFWIALDMVRKATKQELGLNFIVESEQTNKLGSVTDQLYSTSLDLLDTDSSKEMDWHVRALALEVVALQASRFKEEFRPELMDVLYPVLHFMGSQQPQLRSHAIVCLNILAEECGYRDAADIIVSNVDYLVNAVGIKLNLFDLAPQAPQVLLLMVKLAGHPVLPYLDDVVESIFAALENFHGYSKLVEMFFAVLRAIVEEAVKAPQLAIEGPNPNEKRLEPTTMLEVAAQLKARRERETSDIEDIPARTSSQADQSSDVNSDVEEGQLEQEARESPPAPQTYALLANVTRLTQHYLTASSLPLRISLFSLLKTALPALARHENSFLPMINTLWPVVLPRLHDNEAFAVAAALDVIAVMCEQAGDFMKSRIEDAWRVLEGIEERCRRSQGRRHDAWRGEGTLSLTLRHSDAPARPAGASGADPCAFSSQHSPGAVLWRSLVGLMASIVSHVAVNDEAFEYAVRALLPELDQRPDVRAVLESRNADMVWLVTWRKQQTSEKLTNQAGQFDVLPQRRSRWNFTQMTW